MTEADLILGQHALNAGIINQQQLDAAIEIQLRELESHGRQRFLGQIFVEQGYLTEEALAGILDEQARAALTREDALLRHRFPGRNGSWKYSNLSRKEPPGSGHRSPSTSPSAPRSRPAR